jgi:hypothetical protein
MQAQAGPACTREDAPMADHKPPRHDRDERATLTALLQYQRESFARKLDGVSDDDARRALVPSGTTLLWLAKHVATAEQIWVVRRFAGEDAALDDTVRDGDTLAAALAHYRATWERVDAIIAAEASLDAPCRALDDDVATNLRWVLAHLLEETARHAGHADILRELLDGATGR